MRIVVAEEEHFQEVGHMIKGWLSATADSFLLGEPRDQNFVAIKGGQIVGAIQGHHEQSNLWRYVEGYENNPEGWLCSYVSMIYVHPEFRRCRVGAELLRAFADDMRKCGTNLALVMRDESKPGLKEALSKFYSASGFTAPKMLDSRYDLMALEL